MRYLSNLGRRPGEAAETAKRGWPTHNRYEFMATLGKGRPIHQLNCEFSSSRRDSPDVVCPQLSRIHFEVKAVERLNVNEAMAQAVEDAGDKIPVIAHKRNQDEWLVTMRASDWFQMVATARPASAAAV